MFSGALGNAPPKTFHSFTQHVLGEPPELSARVFALQGPLAEGTSVNGQLQLGREGERGVPPQGASTL